MTNKKIRGGSFHIARKMYNSRIWMRSPMHLKVWIWIIGHANFKDIRKNEKLYQRGELETTYDKIIKGTAYYYNRKHILPTLKQIRIILKWLENENMIHVEPLRNNERPTGADIRERTRAYVGIRIVVVNYDIYQDLDSYKGIDKGRPFVQLGHDNNNEQECIHNPPEKISKEIYSLRQRYSNQNLIDKAFEAIASTRKSNKVADSILLDQLQKWKKFPPESVENSIQTYLERDYAGQGKDEKYLLGIIRNSQKHNKTQNPQNEDWMAGAI